jgi:hypothetical protein
MRGANARSSSPLPAELVGATPRDVRLKACGMLVAILAVVSAIGGLWGGVELYRRARLSERYVALFKSEAVPTQARIVRARGRGEPNHHAVTIDYEYVVNNTPYKGRATVRGDALDRYDAGSMTDVAYLASHPAASWLLGTTPSRDKIWPAYIVPVAGLTLALVLVARIRRQSALLRDGRPAMATITSVKKRISDQDKHWRVEYQWTLLSGATRTARYNHHKRRVPEIGSLIPIVYDRDDPKRCRKYPMSLVAVRT